MQKSESITNIAYALSLAQEEMPHVKFDSKNPFLKNKYASLGAVIDASVPVMAQHGLSIAQFPVSESVLGSPEKIGVRTILMHSSGEFLEDVIYVPLQTSKGLSGNQEAGVSISYLRRYSWAAVLGLVSEEDTDGDNNPASKENADADEKVSTILKRREWTNEQTQAASVLVLDSGGEPLSHDDVCDVLDYSALPVEAGTKAIQSWFKHYMKTEGSVVDKAQAANEVYMKAKKTGGK